MTLTEKIFARLENLPEGYQAEVLDFVEFLESKARKIQEPGAEERIAWSDFSLAQAMGGMEDEEELYSVDDLEAVY